MPAGVGRRESTVRTGPMPGIDERVSGESAGAWGGALRASGAVSPRRGGLVRRGRRRVTTRYDGGPPSWTTGGPVALDPPRGEGKVVHHRPLIGIEVRDEALVARLDNAQLAQKRDVLLGLPMALLRTLGDLGDAGPAAASALVGVRGHGEQDPGEVAGDVGGIADPVHGFTAHAAGTAQPRADRLRSRQAARPARRPPRAPARGGRHRCRGSSQAAAPACWSSHASTSAQRYRTSRPTLMNRGPTPR